MNNSKYTGTQVETLLDKINNFPSSVPSKVSELTNDSGFLTSAGTVSIYSGTTNPSSSLGNNGDIYIKTS